jgi:hypothetical protein
MENWVGTKYLIFCSGSNASTFSTFTKEVFNAQSKGAWYSPSTLPTISHGQALWFSDLFILNIRDEHYSGNASFALNFISESWTLYYNA